MNVRISLSQVHAANKNIPRTDDDALLRQVAKLSIGYSGAELANLLNEAAIISVSALHPDRTLFYHVPIQSILARNGRMRDTPLLLEGLFISI